MALFLIGLLVPLTSCQTTANATQYEADGVYVRHLRLRFAPAHTKAFEALMENCVAVATERELDETHAWMCYRESPGRYWIITFSKEREGFALPASLPGFVGFMQSQASAEVAAELAEQLAALEYETEWMQLMRQKTDWSTVASMTSATHPKARMMERTIRPGMEDDFETALRARTAFFAEHDYPLPVEGFVVLDGAPGTAMQVVFPVDWPSFHATTSFYEFVKSRSEEAQADYAGRKAALMVTMSRAEYYNGDHVEKLSFRAP